MICQAVDRVTSRCGSTYLMDSSSTWHPGNVTEVIRDDLIYYWIHTGQVCDVVLASDTEYSTMTSRLKLSAILASSAHTVHASAAYRSVERTSAYACILVGRDNRLSRHIFVKDAISEDAKALSLVI